MGQLRTYLGRLRAEATSFASVVLGQIGIAVDGQSFLNVFDPRHYQWRLFPVGTLEMWGHRYIVLDRGETRWAQDLRLSQRALLVRGLRARPVRAFELRDCDKPPVLRAYLRRYGKGFRGLRALLTPDADDDQFAALAPRYPVFRLVG